MSAILNAIGKGFTSSTVLNAIKRKWPQYVQKINAAQYAGYSASRILKTLSGDKENDEEQYQTEYEQTLNRDRKQKRAAALGMIGAAGLAGYGASKLLQQGQAVRGQVLPPLPGQGRQPRSPRRPGGGPGRGPQPGPIPNLPGAQRQGLPYLKGSNQPQRQQPTQGVSRGSSVPAVQDDEFPQVPELQKLAHKKAAIGQMYDLAQQGKVGGNRFLKAANSLIKTGTLTDVDNFSNFYNWWNATEGQVRGGPLVEYEKFRVQTKGMFNPPSESVKLDKARIQDVSPEQVQQQPEGIQKPQPMQQEVAQEQGFAPQIMQQPKSIRERTQQAAFADKPELKRLVDTSFKGKEFAIPTYQFPGEPKQEFENRKIINEAVKKAATEISKGKTFLDFEKISPDVLGVGGISTAEDVLRFMAGIPNVYDPLLDDTEKQELYDGLMETGQASIEGLRPSEGERGIHGAQMTPNMVWNLLLTVEPRLYKMERPKAIKGATKPGEKMDSTGFRRYLTHSVYGVLSGKTIGPDLSEKIAKISRATATCDAIVKAANDGNFKKVLREIEAMSDDEIVMRMFDEETDDLVAQYGVKSMKPAKGSAADTRYANELKKNREGKNKNTLTVYHGGPDIGEDTKLKRYQKQGSDAGGIFFTDTPSYAKSYISSDGGNVYEAEIDPDDYFDISNPKHVNKLGKTASKQVVDALKATASHGAVDWATGSQFEEEFEEAGFKGAKFLERPGEHITRKSDGSFEIKGNPVYSYVFFGKEYPVKKSKKYK